ncbi:hypothetical protein TNCT_144371 [Trichonephila clavata]|uniref:Uncharacterized protein n=1 Tax=Trichonephila clavata TaxID=2740835 RepID=A0A8X6J6K1_TRICU|nr:hypothetical protein TNCT_144371 [Trichonephila clavata]
MPCRLRFMDTPYAWHKKNYLVGKGVFTYISLQLLLFILEDYFTDEISSVPGKKRLKGVFPFRRASNLVPGISFRDLLDKFDGGRALGST